MIFLSDRSHRAPAVTGPIAISLLCGWSRLRKDLDSADMASPRSHIRPQGLLECHFLPLFPIPMTSYISPVLMTLTLHPAQGFTLTPYSPCTPPPPLLPVQSPIILHNGFLSPPPAFPIDALSTHLAPTSRAPSPIALPFASVFDFDDDETGKSPKVQPARPQSQGENPVRPPARPHSAVRSKFDLEPNPFDVSFSKSSYHSNSDLSERNTPPRGTDATAIKHNALPPLSSLTSPAAADPSQFPWLASQSLRTGPLSPAMLAGPAQANGQANAPRPAEGQPSEGTFDQNTFRTGFTPGASTGFTPNYSSLMAGNFASSLPMPSPNTAAFLNMVTNSTPMEGAAGENGQAPQAPAEGQPPHPPTAIPPHMQQHHGLAHLQPQQHGGEMGQETITPGTLSALTGVFNDMNRGVPPHAPHPPQFFQPGMPHPPPGMPPHTHAHQGAPHADYAQQSANAASQAANGLFLLSQAHQELSKREEEGRGTAPLMGKRAVSNLPPNARPQPPQNASSTAGTKRKSDAGQAKAGKKGKKNTPEDKMESASPNFDSDDDADGDKRSNNGKPETEEDKRKNFLERNRQGETI